FGSIRRLKFSTPF
ncbi:hypothetical protein VCHENC02_1211B, partial [Vibrio harveyi]